MVDELLSNCYFKSFVVVVLALCLTFVHELDIFRYRLCLVAIGVLLLLMMLNNFTRDYGIVILMACLFVVVYNQQVIGHKYK